jgi:cell division protein FtsW (lipid II flippase)
MNNKIFGIIFPLFFILAATRSIEQVKWISYSSPVFFLYFLFIGYKGSISRELKLGLLFFASFGAWALMTSFWSSYPRESLIRSIFFLVSSCSLIFAGYNWVRNFNNKEFGFLTPLNILLLIVSVFSLMTKIPDDYWGGFGYGLKSFWGHQNTLGSLIVFTIPGIFVFWLRNNKIKLLVISALSFLNLYILVLTHSRTSLAVLLLSIILFLVLLKRFKIFVIVLLIFTCVGVIYFVNKDFNSVLNKYLFKTEVSFLDRKKPIISASYVAAKHGGWKGLGFGVSDSTVEKDLQYNIHYHFEGIRLVREKGVSVFSIIEETGWVGMILFFFAIAYLFYLSILTYLKNKDGTSALIICVLFGMCIHAQLEGWWLGVGSVQFPLFMGVVGIIIGKMRTDVIDNPLK